jgi:hypothetical protein
MIRARSAFAATLITLGVVGMTLAGSNATAGLGRLDATPEANGQSSGSGQAQPFKPILGGKKFTAPVKGLAEVQYLKPVTKREKSLIVTRISVKNVSNGPIARLTIDETWYGKDGQTVTGGKGFINGMLQPGEIKTVEIQTTPDPRMYQNNYNFSHANGTVKPHPVKAFEDQGGKKEPAAKGTSASRKGRH